VSEWEVESHTKKVVEINPERDRGKEGEGQGEEVQGERERDSLSVLLS
jgi:hypothetical protein